MAKRKTKVEVVEPTPEVVEPEVVEPTPEVVEPEVVEPTPEVVEEVKSPAKGIQIKIDAVVAANNENSTLLEFSYAVKSFVSTAVATLITGDGDDELNVILTAYRELEEFELVNLNSAIAPLVPTTNADKLKSLITFHTLMNGICDGTKKQEFLKTIDLDNTIAIAGLSSARHLF